jgi:lipopolysaccharide transport system permease protein
MPHGGTEQRFAARAAAVSFQHSGAASTFDTVASLLELVRVWTHRIIRGRYRQSVLGWLWAIVQPIANAAIFSIIFVYFVPVKTGGTPYVLFSYAAMIPWTLFSSSITDMVESLVSNSNLVTKIYFPREVLPVAATLARLLDFVIAGVPLAGLMIYYRAPIYLEAIWIVPIIVFVQTLLGLGIGLIGAALNVFYRDIRHLVTLGLQLWFYATPIIYPASAVPHNLLSFYYLNPMAGIVTAYRIVLFDHGSPWSYLGYPVGCAVVLAAVGLWLFRGVEAQFADVM